MPAVTPTPKDVLLVVDVQNDFVSGSVAIPDAMAVIPVINRLSTGFNHVVFTQDWHPRGHVSFASSHRGTQPGDRVATQYGEQILYADHCLQGESGAELASGLDLRNAVLRLHKGCRIDVDSYSAFTENDGRTTTGLGAYLRARGIERVFATGLALYGCVRHSSLDALKAGFSAFIIDDACRARSSPSDSTHAIELLQAGVTRLLATDLI
jgi:nicotinamidase/pyrazinamidase